MGGLGSTFMVHNLQPCEMNMFMTFCCLHGVLKNAVETKSTIQIRSEFLVVFRNMDEDRRHLLSICSILKFSSHSIFSVIIIHRTTTP
jgi:hypothetical protein